MAFRLQTSDYSESPEALQTAEALALKGPLQAGMVCLGGWVSLGNGPAWEWADSGHPGLVALSSLRTVTLPTMDGKPWASGGGKAGRVPPAIRGILVCDATVCPATGGQSGPPKSISIGQGST